MDSMRKVVQAICEKIADAANSEALWSEKGPGGEYKRDPEHELTPSEGAAAIMSALERVPGVVVKELGWRIDPDLGAEFGFMPGFDEFCYSITPYTKDGAQVWSAWLDDPDEGDLPEQGPFMSPEAAKAACQADFAKRITSAVEPADAPDMHAIVADMNERNPGLNDALKAAIARRAAVEPSCVVSGIPRELLSNCIAVLNEFGSSGIPEWDEAPDTAVTIRPAAQRRGLPELRDMTLGVGDFVAARHYAAALSEAAALSSRTEEEVHRHFVRDVANLSLSGEVTDEDEGTIFDPWPHEQHECLEKLIRRARDIKGGVSDV